MPSSTPNLTSSSGAPVVVDIHNDTHIRVADELEALFKGKKKEDLKSFYKIMVERVVREHGMPDASTQAAYHHWQNGVFIRFRDVGEEKTLVYDIIVASALLETIDLPVYLRGYTFHLLRAGVTPDEILGKAKTYLG